MRQQINNYRVTKYLSALLGVLLCVTAAVAAAQEQEQGPTDVVTQAASELQNRLSGRQEFYAANTAELHALVGDVLLPNFDVEYAGKLVLGKTHWRAADASQRERFIEVFYSFLIKTYAKGVLEFDQEKLLILPDVSFSKSGSKALVRTELVVDAGDNVQVNYAVRSVDSGWKIYDVRIEGVSYIQNYRNQFDAEISAQGIEAVIVRLEQETEQAKAQSNMAEPQTT
jgi:phospholipid transport system substrate-binding protein